MKLGNDLKRRVARGAWSIAKDKAQIHMSAEKVQSYETAFQRIQEITGIDDIELLVDRFIESEERNFSMFKYINHLNQDIERLDNQISDARAEIEKYRGQGADTDSQRAPVIWKRVCSARRCVRRVR